MNCHGSSLKRFFDLGYQPNGNNFPRLDEFKQEQTFPFAMLVCTDCWQVQIEEFPTVDSMFVNHPYVTGLNQPVVSHFEVLAQEIIKKFQILPNSLILDIGANDGTLLAKFRAHGMRVLGIDPCKRTNQLASNIGITIFETFWNQKTAQAMKSLGIRPDIITATAVFYHVEDIHDFIQGLDIIMDENTVFCTQCVYLKDIIEKLQFDHFYHEHTMIHAIAPLKDLFAKYNMRLLDVDFYPIHGGSFVLYVARNESPFLTSEKIESVINKECHFGLHNLKTYQEFFERVEKNKNDLLSLLKEIKMSGKNIFGLGAPLKGSTLLNYYNIGTDFLDYVTEVNTYKIGRYTPGTHIPIIHEDSVKEQPDYYLILSWNFLDFFVEKYADYLNNGGKFIVPHPKVRIIEKNI